MGRYQNYSTEFKDAIIRKILNRGVLTIGDVCEKEGLNRTTVNSWIKRGTFRGMTNNVKSKNWSAEDKLKALAETIGSNENDRGHILRRKGLHSHQIDEWKKQALVALEPVQSRGTRKDLRDDRIKLLERELMRKDRALAEASALLILQKKVNLIWENVDQESILPKDR